MNNNDFFEFSYETVILCESKEYDKAIRLIVETISVQKPQQKHLLADVHFECYLRSLLKSLPDNHLDACKYVGSLIRDILTSFENGISLSEWRFDIRSLN